MSEPLTLPESVVDRLAQLSPSSQDVESITASLQRLQANPESGVPVPFASEEYQGLCVAWTPDQKWRIIFRPKESEGLDVLSIDLESVSKTT